MPPWGHEAIIRHALAFEAGLAQAEAAEGLISEADADAIVAICETVLVDAAELAEEAALAGTLAIPLVRRLRTGLADGPAAAVHRGATSQDLADTVLACQMRDATALLDVDLARTADALAALADRYAERPAIGRTLLQDALPIAFGLRIAHWRIGIVEATARLRHEVADAAGLQFGGPVGTRAGLRGRGDAVAARLASALRLPDMAPWHTRRGGLAGVAAALAIVIGALAKMARDVSLLAQGGIGETREPAIPGRGGSSAMAHKRNPTGCQVALSAALRGPGLVAGILSGLPAELERGIGGWQAEGPALAELFLLAAGAADAMATVAEGLEIHDAVLLRNLGAAGLGSDIGESAELVARLLARENERSGDALRGKS